MSLDLVVLTTGSAASYEEAVRVYQQEEQGAADDRDKERLAQFAADVDRDYGDAGEWPFAGDPIVMATHVLLTVTAESWEDVVPAIVATAHRHGLVALDPQEEKLFPPGRTYETTGHDMTPTTTVHARKIVVGEARRILRPLGIQQRGRSNLWYDDQGWWVGLIELRPSSYGHDVMNVAVQWLWDTVRGDSLGTFHHPPGHEVLDLGGAGYIPYENDEQFTTRTAAMLDVGVKQALHFREVFPDVQSAARVLTRQEDAWQLNAAIALGIVGEIEDARRRLERHLDRYASDEHPSEWQDREAERARSLLALVGNTTQFRAEIASNVREVRKAVKLDPEAPLPF